MLILIFNEHLKISIEELYIALNDDVDLLTAKAGFVAQNPVNDLKGRTTLYPNGFNAFAFTNVIEESKVWANRDLISHNYHWS